MTLTKTKVQIPIEFKELFNPIWRYLVFYGGRGSGKSHSVARSLLLRGRQQRIRILCTRELQKSIKDSVHKLLSDLIEQYGFTDYIVMKDSITNRITGSEFIFMGIRHNVTEIKSTEGIDVCWVEEAQSITEESLGILTPTIRKEGSQIIFTFNRFNELDPVYERFVVQKPAGTYVAQVNFDVLEKHGLLPDVIRLEIDADRENPSLFAHKWLGEPISQSDFAILPRDGVLEAMNRDTAAEGKLVVGVDVARMGSDRTVFWMRKGLKSLDYKVMQQKRTTEVCDLLEQFIDFNKSTELKVDDTGVGGGVTDEMIKRDYNVIPVNFGGKPANTDKYPNWISEAWFTFAEILPEVRLIKNPDLLMELSTRQWKQDIHGKRSIESKNEYKKRGFRSPDLADAVIICYAEKNVLSSDDIFL